MITLSELTQSQRESAFAKRDKLLRVDELKSGGKVMKEALKAVGISRATYFAWKKRFRKYGVPGLADHIHKRREGKFKMTREQQAFMCECMLNQNRPKSKTVYEMDYLTFCESIDQEPVSYNTFLRMFDEIPEPVKRYYNEGLKAFADSNPYIQRDLNSLEPMELIVSDHYRMDMMMVTKQGKLFRPWVTWWMDIATRMPLGWIMSLKPSQDTINMALFYTVQRYGRPLNVYIDNGKDYTSKVFMGIDEDGKKSCTYKQEIKESVVKGIYSRLGANVIFAIPYNAKAKPIEPAHRTIHNIERRYYGFVGSNVMDRPEEFKGVVASAGQKYEIKMDKLPNYSEMESRLDEIMYEYANRSHSGLGGKSPQKVWNERFEPAEVLSPEDVALLMMKPDRQLYKVSAQGVYFKGAGKPNWYFHPGMVHYEGKKVGIRYDPRNLDEYGYVNDVRIYDAKDRFLFVAHPREKVNPLQKKNEVFRMVGQQKKIRKKAAENYMDKRKSILQRLHESMSN